MENKISTKEQKNMEDSVLKRHDELIKHYLNLNEANSHLINRWKNIYFK